MRPPPELYEIYAVDRYHPSVFARLFLTHYFDESVTRVVFLDGDLLICGDVSDLVGADLHGRTLGAVPMNFGGSHSVGPLTLLPGGYADFFATAGVPLSVELFNCGVMVIDLHRWRDRGLEAELVNLAKRYPRNDQDLLNILLWNDWAPLPHRWNSKRPDSVIYHFASNPKPWEPGYYLNSARLQYAQAAARVGWKIEQPRFLHTQVRVRSAANCLIPPVLRRS